MTTYRIEWIDNRFDGMAAGDRLDSVRALVKHGTLDFHDDGVTDVRVREVPAVAGAPALTLEPLAPTVGVALEGVMQVMREIDDVLTETNDVLLDLMPAEGSA